MHPRKLLPQALLSFALALCALPAAAHAAYDLVEDGSPSQDLGFDGGTDGSYLLNGADGVYNTGATNPASWSFEGWVYTQSTGDFNRVLTSLASAWPALYMDNPSGQLLYANGTFTIGLGQIVVPLGWHFLAVTYDAGSTTTNLYIDGSLVDTSGSSPGTLDLSSLEFGNTFTGKIDEFRLKDVAISGGQVASDMSGTMSCDGNTLWLYHMDGTAGAAPKMANACAGGGGGSSSSSGSGSLANAMGSLVYQHSACNTFTTNESGSMVCSQWDTSIDVPFLRFAFDAYGLILVQILVGAVVCYIALRWLWAVCKWFFRLFTQRFK